MNYKLFLILKLDWINSDVQLLMLMFLTLLLLLDLHQITMIICCMWCSVYYLFCLTKPKWLDGVFTFPTRAKNGWLSIALACSSYAETAQCWSPLRIGLNGLNAFCWGRASTDHSLHALCRGPLAFVSPNNDGIGAPLLGKNHCSLWPMGTHQMDVYVICEFLCICVCVWMVMQRWMHVKWTSLSHQAFASTLWRRKGGTSHQERANHILAVWIYARPFGL